MVYRHIVDRPLNTNKPIVYTAAETDVLEIEAPYDCWILVTFTCLGWGYAGGLLVFSIRAENDTVADFDLVGGCQGSDMINRYLRADAIFKGVQKGTTHRFARYDITGSFGQSNNRRWCGICFPS